MEIEALKRSMIPIIFIFASVGFVLTLCSYYAGESIGGVGMTYAGMTIFWVGMMYLACQYFGYKTSEIYYLDELECKFEMFSRYSAVISDS